LVLLAEGETIHRLAVEEDAVARIGDADLLEHLANDHADVLVVDPDTLQAVDLLHLVEQVLLHRARTLDLQDLVRRHRAFGEAVTGPHAVTLVHAQVLACRPLVHPRPGAPWPPAARCGRAPAQPD